MKVTLFRRNSLGGFSIENITENLANHLSGQVDVKIFSPSYSNKGILNCLKSMLEVIRHQGDINHITGDSHFLSYFLNKRKTIITIHDCERLMTDNFSFFKKAIYKLFWFIIPNLRCAYITTVSKESRANLIRFAGINKDRILVIYDGIDDRFASLGLSQEEKNNLLQNKEHKKTVLHVSNIKEIKNVKRLIEAIKNLDVKFIKVGELAEDELKLLIEYNIDYIQFKNIEIGLLIKIYNSVDCLVFPSLIEGFGLPIIEAQKCACPVVTSNITCLPEIAGKGAVYVNPYSVDSIQKGITDILNNNSLKLELIDEGLKNAKRFQWDIIAAKYCQLYSEVAKNKE
jgi:glycosyltransferase involved in cell wall biosynthesis